MPSGIFDIVADQGSLFSFFIEYQDSSGTGIDLSGYTAEMQVRRATASTNMLLQVVGGSGGANWFGVTSGGVTGYFSSSTFGVPGSGGITLNGSSADGLTGPLGVSGHTGGIFMTVDPTSMSYVPAGSHFYDLQIYGSTGPETILRGRFVVTQEVTQ